MNKMTNNEENNEENDEETEVLDIPVGSETKTANTAAVDE